MGHSGIENPKLADRTRTRGRVWTAGRAGEPLSWAPLTADATDGGEEGNSERESLIQSRKVPSALATLATLRATHAPRAQRASPGHRRNLPEMC